MNNNINNSWKEDFPKVMHFIDLQNTHAKPWALLTKHPDYDAAKNHEDRGAAARLVENLLSTAENKAQIKEIKEKYRGAIVVPVRALEAQGKNRLPEALADFIGHKTDLEVDTGIVQTNEVHRTGADAWHRLAFRPEFDGEVKEGHKYILVDDVFSNGGSFNELRGFIEKNGGEVVQTAALSLGGHGEDIALKKETRKKLVDKFGQNELKSFLQEARLYDGNCNALTEPEAYALVHAKTLDDARNRIAAARCAGESQVLSETFREREADSVTQKRTIHR
jgi:hypothetical protein